jgi:hypothetical protein
VFCDADLPSSQLGTTLHNLFCSIYFLWACDISIFITAKWVQISTLRDGMALNLVDNGSLTFWSSGVRDIFSAFVCVFYFQANSSYLISRWISVRTFGEDGSAYKNGTPLTDAKFTLVWKDSCAMQSNVLVIKRWNFTHLLPKANRNTLSDSLAVSKSRRLTQISQTPDGRAFVRAATRRLHIVNCWEKIPAHSM